MNKENSLEKVTDSQIAIIKKFKASSMWYLITIEDLYSMPGKSIFNIIQLFLKKINFNFIILNDIIGGGLGILPLQKKQDDIVETKIFLTMLSEVVQFEWGDFFLFKESPANWNHNPEDLYPELISQTDTTIRAIDNHYIYVYTTYEDILNLINENYIIESIKIGSLEHLDYPW